MAEPQILTSAELGRNRRRYYLHSILSGVSFRLLAGSIITLYALRLGAGNTFVGLLSSFMHVSMLFLLVGRRLVARMGAVRLQSVFWAVRYLAMAPAVLTVHPAVRSNPPLAFALLAIGVFGFHTAKSIAMAGQKTILGLLVGARDRGAVLSRIQSLNTGFSTVAWLLVGLALGRDAPLGTYAVTFAVGIFVGLAAAWALSGLPEPQDAEAGSGEKLFDAVRSGLTSPGYRRLTVVIFLKNLFLGMTGAFLIVQFKRVFMHGDGEIVYITLVGSLGVIAMAALAGLLMDRVGARPLYFAFSVVTALTLLPIVIGPAAPGGWAAWIIPCAVFFFYQMGSMGMANCSQDYFFATVKPEERLNLGVAYNINAGVAGFLGSFGGGLILDGMLASRVFPEVTVFRIYFGVLFAAMVVVSLAVVRLPNIGAYSIANTLSILFSPRDLRAIRLLRRLDQSQTAEEERQTIRALARNPSAVSVDDLLQRLRSPLYSLRMEALGALRHHPLDPGLSQALVTEVRDHEYTTAHVAAEIIGDRRVSEAIPALREALGSDDFMLCGKAMFALAQLGDRESLDAIRRLFEATPNPRLIIHGARAFARLKAAEMVPVLTTRLEPTIAPFIRDEIILALAEIAGMRDWFYPLYMAFLERQEAGVAELRERAARDGELAALAGEVTAEPEIFGRLAGKLAAERGVSVAGMDYTALFAAAATNPELMRLARFRFLFAGLLIREAAVRAAV